MDVLENLVGPNRVKQAFDLSDIQHFAIQNEVGKGSENTVKMIKKLFKKTIHDLRQMQLRGPEKR